MKKIIVSEMVSLDGVMQAPGGVDEDRSGGFDGGGWTAAFGDQDFMDVLSEQMGQADYLLGRKTFEIWEEYWPKHGDFWPAINSGNKYVLSSTRESSDWDNSYFLRTVDDIRKLKESEGRDLQVWGSSELAQLLFEHDLVDEIWLKIYPVILGNGKTLFKKGSVRTAFEVFKHTVTPKGVFLASYRHKGRPVFKDVHD